MPFGLLSQVCHTPCSSSLFLTAASVSFTPLRSFLPSFPFIPPRSQLSICCKPVHPLLIHNSLPNKDAPILLQAIPAILTGFHFTSLRHTFTSGAFSPPAAFYCCARLAATVCVTGFHWHKYLCLYGDAICCVTPLHCASIMPEVILLSAPVSGTRSHIRSCLPPVPL